MSTMYGLVQSNEVQGACNIEMAGYPPDEAASLSVLQYRQSNAPDLFLGAYVHSDTGRTLIGYVCATLSPATSLSHESMSAHVPDSASVCIHSVCVAPERRRKGVALGLLQEYVARLERAGKHERVLLITHEELRGLYEKAGFQWVGPSAVVHGARPWFEMRRELARAPSAPDPIPPPSVSAGLWEALQHSSASRTRPIGRALTAFPNGAQDLAVDDGKGGLANRHDLLCPRDGCGSIILKNGVAMLLERASMQLEPPEHTAASLLPPLPSPPGTTSWWLVTPNVMVFENIGFSRAVVSEGRRLKLLSCAECDLGPLGWCEEGGCEFWLACSRVTYRE